jgi:hypothetical protein
VQVGVQALNGMLLFQLALFESSRQNHLNFLKRRIKTDFFIRDSSGNIDGANTVCIIREAAMKAFKLVT